MDGFRICSIYVAVEVSHLSVFVQEPLDADAFYTYKSKIAMLLLAIVDARGRFLWVNAGAPGSQGDAGVWQRDVFRTEAIEKHGLMDTPKAWLHNPSNQEQPWLEVSPFFVGDGAFAFTRYMMKCFPETQEAFSQIVQTWNRLLCDTRKVVEQAFGRLKMKWQFCFSNVWQNEPAYVRSCILVCCALHNFCMDQRVDYDQQILNRMVDLHNKTCPLAQDVQMGDAGGPDGVAGSAQFIREWMSRYVAYRSWKGEL